MDFGPAKPPKAAGASWRGAGPEDVSACALDRPQASNTIVPTAYTNPNKQVLLIGSRETYNIEPPDRFEADAEIMDVLKKRSDFLTVAKGKRCHSPSMVVQMIHTPALHSIQKKPPNPESGPRVGFTVTKRVGNAVARNRVRRRLRAAAHQIVPVYGHAGRDYVLIGRKAALEHPFECLLDDLKGALIKLEQSKRPSRRSIGNSGRARSPSQTQS